MNNQKKNEQKTKIGNIQTSNPKSLQTYGKMFKLTPKDFQTEDKSR